MIDVTSYKAASRLAVHINAGASWRLRQGHRECLSLDPEARAAWLHGWDTTDEAENRAGRPLHGATSMEGLLQPIIDRALSLIDNPSAVVRVNR